jgi:2-phospho-L-lactate guanylyltransferase
VEVFALIPLNATPRVKTRLAGVLTIRERIALARWMAGHVLDAVQASEVVAKVAVVSPDAEALAWAAGRGAVALRQEGSGLNSALELGRDWALARHAEALLIALADLPYVSAADIAALVGLLPPDGPAAVLAADRHERGTNALLLRPPGGLPFGFGRDSFQRHEARAVARGMRTLWYTSEGTRRDVDTPGDLAELVASGLWQPVAVLRDH